MMNKDILIHFLPFGTSEVKGLVKECVGKYEVAINSDLPNSEQFEAVLHELAHIYLNHFKPGTDLTMAELEAHNFLMSFGKE